MEGPDDDIFDINSHNRVNEQPRSNVQQVDEEANWNSEPENDDELKSLKGSDDEESNEQVEFNEKVHMKNPELICGMKFPNAQTFRKYLKEWNVVHGYDIEFDKNESSRITAKCRLGCTWRIHASKVGKEATFAIKTIKGTHECGRQYSNKQADSRYLGKTIVDEVKDNPGIDIPSLQKKIRRNIMIDASRFQVYRAKRNAWNLIAGDMQEQYLRIWDYAETVRKQNPGSHIIIKTYPDCTEPTFQRMYYRLSSMKDGFLAGCRPIIGLDGCHLKGIYGGQLLTAIGRDGNENLFPIALALVDIESKDSWMWFMRILVEDIGDGPWTFISDRQKGLVETFQELLPTADHRYCLRHMYSNFKLQFPGTLMKELFWRAASTYNVNAFHYWMKKIEEADPKLTPNQKTAADWLRKTDARLWARSHFSTNSKCDVVVNNFTESFNSYILQARDLPIISMFDGKDTSEESWDGKVHWSDMSKHCG